MKIKTFLLAFIALSPSLASAQATWSSLWEMPYKSILAIFDADSAKFTAGATTLNNYDDGQEMKDGSGGWWDTRHKAAYPSNSDSTWGLIPGNAAGRNPIWLSSEDTINGHATVKFVPSGSTFDDSVAHFSETSTTGTPWSDYLHKGEFTIAMIFKTKPSPSDETEIVFYTSVNSSQIGVRLQAPSADSTRIAFVITNGSANIVVFNPTGNLQVGQWHIMVMTWDYGSPNYDFNFYLDSATASDSVESTGAPSASAPSLSFQFGRGTTIDQAADSLLVPLAVFGDSALAKNGTDVQKLIEYFDCRYNQGITAASGDCAGPFAASSTTAAGDVRRRGLLRTRRMH